jgi:nickel/cobalt transporter (NicO) family protein
VPTAAATNTDTATATDMGTDTDTGTGTTTARSPTTVTPTSSAAAVGRAWFGFLLVLAFGVGMAASLAAVGLLARDLVLRLEGLASRRGFIGGNVRTYLRYGAAVGICLVGGGVIVRTLVQL